MEHPRVAASCHSRSRARRALSRLVAGAAAALLLVNVLSLFAAQHWLAELAVHFAMHYVPAAALLGAALASLGRWRWAAACVLVMALNGWRVLPDEAPSGERVADAAGVPSRPGTAFTLLQWNVGRADPERALGWFLEHEADVDLVALFEIDGRWDEALEVLARFYPVRRVVLRNDAFGIAVFSRLPETELRTMTQAGSGLPSVIAIARPADGPVFGVWMLHPPPPLGAGAAGERNRQLASIARVTGAHALPMVVAGDLNVTPYSPWFRRLLADGGLVNLRSPGAASCAPRCSPTWAPAWAPTWAPTWAPRAVPVWLGLPIDHLLTTPGFVLLEARHGPRNGSDHRPRVTRLAPPP